MTHDASPRRHGDHGGLTETKKTPWLLRALRASVVKSASNEGLMFGGRVPRRVTTADRKARCVEKPSDGPRSSLWYWRHHAGFFRTSFRYGVIAIARVTPSFRLKNWMFRIFLRAKVHKHAAVGLEVTFDIFYPWMITIHEDAVVGYRSTILCHEYASDFYRTGPVVIGKRATIGANCTLLPGVIVGDGAVVSAMSLVNRDIPAGELWGGVPVRKLRDAARSDSEGEDVPQHVTAGTDGDV